MFVALIFTVPSKELFKLSPIRIAGSPYSDVLLQTQVLHLVTNSEPKQTKDQNYEYQDTLQRKNTYSCYIIKETCKRGESYYQYTVSVTLAPFLPHSTCMYIYHTTQLLRWRPHPPLVLPVVRLLGLVGFDAADVMRRALHESAH